MAGNCTDTSTIQAAAFKTKVINCAAETAKQTDIFLVLISDCQIADNMALPIIGAVKIASPLNAPMGVNFLPSISMSAVCSTY